jgi:multidrug resistance efflux pump
MSRHTKVYQERFLQRPVLLAVSLALGATIALGQSGTERITKTKREERSTVTASGEVRPNRYFKVISEVRGRIQEIYVEPGEQVTKGQALVLIESQSSERKNVRPHSPLKGIVADISARVGETVNGGPPGATLMTIADMSKIYVEVNIEEADISKIAIGLPARIIVDAFHEKEIRGLVIRKDLIPVAQSDTKEFRVTLEMREVPKETRSRLRPGMSATAIITTAKRD